MTITYETKYRILASEKEKYYFTPIEIVCAGVVAHRNFNNATKLPNSINSNFSEGILNLTAYNFKINFNLFNTVVIDV